jgi:hypothetical protein
VSTSTARKRKQRALEELGRIVLPVEVDEAAACVALVDAGFITPNEQDDRQKLAERCRR